MRMWEGIYIYVLYYTVQYLSIRMSALSTPNIAEDDLSDRKQFRRRQTIEGNIRADPGYEVK